MVRVRVRAPPPRVALQQQLLLRCLPSRGPSSVWASSSRAALSLRACTESWIDWGRPHKAAQPATLSPLQIERPVTLPLLTRVLAAAVVCVGNRRAEQTALPVVRQAAMHKRFRLQLHLHQQGRHRKLQAQAQVGSWDCSSPSGLTAAQRRRQALLLHRAQPMLQVLQAPQLLREKRVRCPLLQRFTPGLDTLLLLLVMDPLAPQPVHL